MFLGGDGEGNQSPDNGSNDRNEHSTGDTVRVEAGNMETTISCCGTGDWGISIDTDVFTITIIDDPYDHPFDPNFIENNWPNVVNQPSASGW